MTREKVPNPEAGKIREARLRLGMSQQQVASLAGVHIRLYQRLEYGERQMSGINMRLGLTVCAILQLDPYDLVPLRQGQTEAPIRPQPNPEK